MSRNRTIDISPGNMRNAFHEMEKVLMDGDTDMYRFAGELVFLKSNENFTDENRPCVEIQRVSTERLRGVLARKVDFTRRSSKDEVQAKDIPVEHVRTFLGSTDWNGIPRLRGVIDHPILLPGGRVLSKPGYDEETGWYLNITEYLNSWDWDTQITRQDAQRALERLYELLKDFPFVSECDWSAFLAALLTPLARPAINSFVPMHILSANTPGTGKTLLCDVIGMLVTGRSMPRQSQVSDLEFEKRITATLAGGGRTLLIDNVSEALGGDSLDTLLTCHEWRGRILGKSQTCTLENNLSLYATGNNVQFKGDLNRRVVVIRLESPLERPEEKIGFQIPNLLDHIRTNRWELLRDCFIILKSYSDAGSPSQRGVNFGGFDSWARVVRDSLLWAGAADACEARLLESFEDPELEVFSSMLEVLSLVFAEDFFTAKDAAEILEQPKYAHIAEELALLKPNGRINIRALGSALAKKRQRTLSGFRLIRKKKRTASGLQWRITNKRQAHKPG